MPDSLYYFQGIQPGNQREWFTRIIRDKEIYFRSRQNLEGNDPSELRPRIVFDGTKDELRRHALHQLLLRCPEFSPAKRLAEAPKLVRFWQTADLSAMLHEVLERIGILSLASSWQQMSMWTHYADRHRGICIEFAGEQAPFLAAKQVTYVPAADAIRRFHDSSDEVIQKSVFTKLTAYEYEQEWRVIARWMDRDRTERYIAQNAPSPRLHSFIRSWHGPGNYRFDENAIRAILLGIYVDNETERFVRELVRDIPVERVRLADNRTLTRGH